MNNWMFTAVCGAAVLVAFAAQAQEPQSLGEVVVSGWASAAAERRDATTQKVIMERKDIENLGVMTIGEVLGKLPGVEVQGDAQRARGMTRDSVQILVDGERSAGGARMAAAILGRLPSGDLERVEILRGASAEFGGAASVTVNLVMRKTPSKNATEMRAGIGVRGNQVNTQLSYTPSGSNGNFSWSFPVNLLWSTSQFGSQIERQDLAGTTRTLWQQEETNGRTKLGHHAISPRFAWKSGSDSFTVLPMYFWGPVDTQSDATMTKYTAPATGSGLAFNGDRTSQLNGYTQVYRLRLEGEKRVNDFKLTGRTAINNGKKTSDTTRTSHDALNALTTVLDNTKNLEHEFNMALRLDKPLSEANLLAVGLEHINLRRTDEQVLSGAANVYQAQERQSIAWVQDDWMMQPKVTFTYGLRGESIALNSNGVAQQRVQDARLGITRMARETPKYIVSAGLDEGLPSLNSSYGVSMPMTGRSETNIPGEQAGATQARTTMDAFWLYQINPMFKLRLTGQNLFAAGTIKDMAFTSAGNTWQLHSVDKGYRSVMATIEGRW